MLKDIFLQKGWAGKTISREETVERLNPLLRNHIVLNHAYDHVITHHQTGSVQRSLSALQKTARVDAGKFAETIFSCGGLAYSGTDIEPGDIDLGEDGALMIAQLIERESAFSDAIQAEEQIEHQMRTRAILGVVLANSVERLRILRQLERQMTRTT